MQQPQQNKIHAKHASVLQGGSVPEILSAREETT